ncbi:hypothetical protein F5884DRAFT_878676 [Xylogone sp. PMI_703]|nr:hypothetical protein F5884DRAFT_878676 [Xylogone sp. PMI_703]
MGPRQKRMKRRRGEPASPVSGDEELLQKRVKFTTSGGVNTSTSLDGAARRSSPERNTISRERNSWASLVPELQNPALYLRLRGLGVNEGEDIETPFLTNSHPAGQNTLELYPEPKQVFWLWQTFVENVNPVTKIVHIPTIQPYIATASLNPQALSKPIHAMLFSIYLLAITSLPSSKCRVYFEEDKLALLRQYRSTAIQSLIAVNVLETKELELAAPILATSTTLIAFAIRLAHQMRLHDETLPNISLFEREMRIRLWWQIHCLSNRYLQANAEIISPIKDLRDIRMPLNVNDSQLHPDMVKYPTRYLGATEMTYCLLKYEVAYWRAGIASEISLLSNPSKVFTEETVKDLEFMIGVQYLHYCDNNIPLHMLSCGMSLLTVCHVRFMANHPRSKVNAGMHMTSEERDQFFEMSLGILELQSELRALNFSSQLLTYTARIHVDALICMLSELRGRPRGDRVADAWDQVELFSKQHNELMDPSGSFSRALHDLILEAWEVRQKESGGNADAITPQFIKAIQSDRQDESTRSISTSESAALQPSGEVNVMNQLEKEVGSAAASRNAPGYPVHNQLFDVEYWNEFWLM